VGGHLARAQLAGGQLPQDLPAFWLGKRVEDFHPLSLAKAYISLNYTIAGEYVQHRADVRARARASRGSVEIVYAASGRAGGLPGRDAEWSPASQRAN
jgi:hypothetical protein